MTHYLKDRFRGVLLGMACGDALGAQVEFAPRGSFLEQRDMTGGGPHRLRPGQWTDDTAMALLLASRLVVDPQLEDLPLLAQAWISWYRHGYGSCTGECFDIGTQTAAALVYWERFGRQPRHVRDRRGNGALMRVAPVALSSHGTVSQARQVAAAQASVTHPAGCGALCGDFVALLQRCMLFQDPESAIDCIYLQHGIAAWRTRDCVDSSGYDVATFEAAVWAVAGARDLEDAVVRAVNLGDDADTVGAVAGALAGAVWGATGVPSRWLQPLAWGAGILGVADTFYERAWGK